MLGAGCRQQEKKTEVNLALYKLGGETMGTYYALTYVDGSDRKEDVQKGIDSILDVINQELSTYIPTSFITGFNKSDEAVDLATHPHFLESLKASRMIYEQSGGAFDPTVMPLVNFWGFGYTGDHTVETVDTRALDSIRGLVGMDKLKLEGTLLQKTVPGMQIDFNAIAPGYAVDLLGEMLENRGITSYLMDIGGEVRARGQKPDASIWRIGISTPKPEAAPTDIQITFPMENMSVATSGDYRKYHTVKGEKYSHTIDPKTGYSKKNNLLSATVFHPSAKMADGYATACMVSGSEEALAFAKRVGIEAYLIIGNPDGSMRALYTDGLKQWVDAQ